MRAIPLTEFYSTPGDTPGIENMLGHGELITSIQVPLLCEGTRSGYLKVRDRASYEFALASAAVALETKDGTVRDARVALGGLATIPWRSRAAEDVLRGAPATIDHLRRGSGGGAFGRRYSVTQETPSRSSLAKRTIVQALSDGWQGRRWETCPHDDGHADR